MNMAPSGIQLSQYTNQWPAEAAQYPTTQAFATAPVAVENSTSFAGVQSPTYTATTPQALAAPEVNLNEQIVLAKLIQDLTTIVTNNSGQDSANIAASVNQIKSPQDLVAIISRAKGDLAHKLRTEITSTLTSIVTNAHNEASLSDFALNQIVTLSGSSDKGLAKQAVEAIVGLALGHRGLSHIAGASTAEQLKLSLNIKSKAEAALKLVLERKPSVVLESLLENKWYGVNSTVLADALKNGLTTNERPATLNIISAHIPKSEGFRWNEAKLEELQILQSMSAAIKASTSNDAYTAEISERLDKAIMEMRQRLNIPTTTVVPQPQATAVQAPLLVA